MTDKYTREEFAAHLGADGDPKLNAAADFAARLLNGPGGDRVARIVLFGSAAVGVAGPNSDVDVMVFSASPKQQRREEAAQAAWEATVEWGELVAPLTYPLSRLFEPSPYVVYDTLKRGREIYAMEEKEARRREAVALYQKAEQHLKDAQFVLEQAVYSFAVVGAYAAAELAAKALLLLKPGVGLPQTHGGLIQIFSREYVHTGQVPRQWGRLLNEDLELRSGALYDTSLTVTAEHAGSVIRLASEMLEFLQRQLEETETRGE